MTLVIREAGRGATVHKIVGDHAQGPGRLNRTGGHRLHTKRHEQ